MPATGQNTATFSDLGRARPNHAARKQAIPTATAKRIAAPIVRRTYSSIRSSGTVKTLPDGTVEVTVEF
jgi:hypothetical protein